MNGRLYRLCYRNKWLQVQDKPLDWRHYNGQEIDEERTPGKLYRHNHIMIRVTNGTRATE
jgi:hypothetical protein